MHAFLRGAWPAFRLLVSVWTVFAAGVPGWQRPTCLPTSASAGGSGWGVAVVCPSSVTSTPARELVGSDVDTARLLASDLGVRLEIVCSPTPGGSRHSRRQGWTWWFLSLRSPRAGAGGRFLRCPTRLYVVLAGRPALSVSGYADLAGMRLADPQYRQRSAAARLHRGPGGSISRAT